MFAVNQAGREATTLLSALEGPEDDEITLRGTDLAEGMDSGFTFSVKSGLLAELDSIYATDPDRQVRP